MARTAAGRRGLTTQRTLFERERSIQERFEAFHAAHGEVYAQIVRFAREVRGRGFERYSIDALYQRVRWHFQIERKEGDEEGPLLNDNFRSRYARKIMDQEPDLAGFFEVRRLKAD